VLIAVLVAGAYFYARWRFRHLAENIPKKLNIQVQQTAQGFTVSKSEEGRTIFTIRASNAVQYKQGGRAELHDVSITIYGRDAQRFDQIYGSDFEYNQQTGIVVAKGEVQIDLEANPGGLAQPDQAPPKEMKDPIHLKTRGLVLNQKTGDAYTPELIEFQVPAGKGSAVGATYTAKSGTLEMKSQVHVTLTGATPATLEAVHGIMRKDPRQIEFERPVIHHGDEQYQSDHATMFLRDDNTVDHVVGTGNIRIQVSGKSPMETQAERAELFLGSDKNAGNALERAVLSGNVHVVSTGAQAAEGFAGRLNLNFTGKNILTTARAQDNVKLIQHNTSAQTAAGTQSTAKQDVQVSAPVIDFVTNHGHGLKSAVTSGDAQIAILPPNSGPGEQTVVTAAKFKATFDNRSHLNGLHGAPQAKIVNTAPGQAQRVSTSDVVDASFKPEGGIDAVVQQGHVVYTDANLKAWGDRARYTPSDQMLYLTGSPRVVEGGMTTTARTMRMDRKNGDAVAEGDVKSTYSELQEQPNGALLASSDPIHVTSRSMVTHQDPGIATYTGNARLWQNANVIEAPSIQFDREKRSVVAKGSAGQQVSTALVQQDKAGKQTPVNIRSNVLTYTDNERKAHFEGAVTAKSADADMTADQIDVFLKASDPQKKSTPPQNSVTTSRTQTPGQPSQIDKIVANGNIVVVQPNRRAQGTRLVYTADDDKFVLTGHSPSIFDAEHGKITGVSLTFYKRDDRVLVEGDVGSPTVTQTRVAR
jgi:lipopolysaccharide export system protein LptA